MARGKERVELRGKHTVVTGAASGIGLELARVLLEKGAASISLLDIHEKNLAIAEDELRAKAQGTQTQIYALPVDITNESLINQQIRKVHQKFGALDVVFANAAIGPGGRFMDMPADHFTNLMNVNWMGVVLTLKPSLEIMTKQRSGHVIVVNSIGGYMGVLGAPACCSTKSAVRGLVESLRLELMGSGVSIHLSNPSFTDTPMLEDSQKHQSEAIRKVFAEEVPRIHTAKQVADYMILGLEENRYLLPQPDGPSNFFLNSCLVPYTERPYSVWLDALLAPAYVFMHDSLTKKTEKTALRYSALVDPQSAPVISKQQHSSFPPVSLLMVLAAVFLVSIKYVFKAF